jgi:hypothetical protein
MIVLALFPLTKNKRDKATSGMGEGEKEECALKEKYFLLENTRNIMTVSDILYYYIFCF